MNKSCKRAPCALAFQKGWEGVGHMKTAGQLHWDYLLLLEKDLIEILDYIDPCDENMAVFGPKILKLFLSIGSGIDVTLRDLLLTKDSQGEFAHKKRFGIKDYRHFVQDTDLSLEFKDVAVCFDGMEFTCTPWEDWWSQSGGHPTQLRPGWWDSYNHVKHRRTEQYGEANLGNVLKALAGLFVSAASLIRNEQNGQDCVSLRCPALLKFRDRRYGAPTLTNFSDGILEIFGESHFEVKSVAFRTATDAL